MRENEAGARPAGSGDNVWRMEERSLGPLTVSLVGLGCNNFGGRIDATQTGAVVDAALDAGITLFDTADIYGGGRSEELLGKALGSRRDDVVIATKFGMGDGTTLPAGASATTVQRAAEGSLRRLGTDRIDLYQQHQPDDATPIEETLTALDRLVRDGKVRAVGCSNFNSRQIDEAVSVAAAQKLTPFVSVQNELSLLQRRGEAELLDAGERHGLEILPFFPLAHGMLTGKYRRGDEPPPGHPAGQRTCRATASGPERCQPRSGGAARGVRRASAATPCSSWRCRGSPAFPTWRR